MAQAEETSEVSSKAPPVQTNVAAAMAMGAGLEAKGMSQSRMHARLSY